MHRAFHISTSLAIALLMTLNVAAWSQTPTFTSTELDNLLAPIALYPDPLLAQVLPAATFPDELATAASVTGYTGQSSLIDNQPWDVSVRAVSHYPSVLRMMVDSPDWTTALGQAYVNQPAAVMASIQRLRAKAMDLGYLRSNAEQTVSVSNGYISIVPAQAQYVYVPAYNPQVVYVEPRPSYGPAAIAFGVGLFIGAWLNRDVDWHNHRVYYGGWRKPGWRSRARPYVQANERHYTGKTVTVNRNVRNRNISGYKRELQTESGRYVTPGLRRPGEAPPARVPGKGPGARPLPLPTPRPRPTPLPRPTPRPGPGVTTPAPGTRPTTPAKPAAGVTHPAPRPTPAVPAKPGAGVTRPAPRPTPAVPAKPGAGVTHPAPRPTPAVPARPGAGVTRPAPRPTPAVPARPGAGVTHPAPRPTPAVPAKPGAGVTHPAPRPTPAVPARPGAGVSRPAPRPIPAVPARPGAGVTRPAPRPAPAAPARPSGRVSSPAPRPSPPAARPSGGGHAGATKSK